jgi:hypothetical protein
VDGSAASGPDPCKPSLDKPAEVEVGQGQNEFAPLADGEIVQVERGPQGGYHIWLAIRVANLQRSGSRTSISAVVVMKQAALASYQAIFTFDPEEGGTCRLYGLRYRIDTGGFNYQELLGAELDLTVRVSDRSGTSAEGQKRVVLSSDVI